MSAMADTGTKAAIALLARQRLARVLYESMEHFDPNSDETWDELSDSSHLFYTAVITCVLVHQRDVLLALDDA